MIYKLHSLRYLFYLNQQIFFKPINQYDEYLDPINFRAAYVTQYIKLYK